MKSLLIYYGWLNSFNSARNSWDNEKVAQELSKYDVLVFGDGIQDPSHGDFANTSIIVPRIKTLNPDIKIYGYVTINQDYMTFTPKVDQWESLQVHGIFLNEAGYDYGKTRAEFNQRVDYVHGKTYAKLCIANAWNADHVLGTADDINFPNSVYNPSSTASSLNYTDFILLESWPINTAAYTGGYESASDWKARGDKTTGLTGTFGVGFMASNVVANTSADGETLTAFAYTAAAMYGITVFGTSDTNYGASSAAVRCWPRPGFAYSVTPSVFQDTSDTDVYHRVVGADRMSLDFSTSAQKSSLESQIPAYGSLYSANLNQAMAISTTPVKFTLLASAGACKNVSADTVNDRMTIQVPGDYQVTFNLSSLVSTAKDVQIHLRKNGNELPEFGLNTRALTTRTSVGFSNIGTFAAGDQLELYINATSGINITVWDAQLVVRKIG